MPISDPDFVPFLLRAKKATYAAGDAAAETASSRPQSHDLAFKEGDFTYIDTYLGGFAFIGEEAVWKCSRPLWGMNYYGTMTIEAIPDGFGDFLKLALRGVPAEAPYRGPASFAEGRFTYTCRWEGSLDHFKGDETIALDGQVIYILDFHGSKII